MEGREAGLAADDPKTGRVVSTVQEPARAWPERREWAGERRPIALAQADYTPAGYVVDFVIIPDQGTPTTLASGQTYYIRTSYYSGSSVTFQPGCVIKFKNKACMLLYGPVSFPGSGTRPVFTSRNDDLFGERIVGVPNEPDSDGNPTQHRAAQAIWIYYVNFNTTIQNVDVRWAQRAIQYDVNPGVYVTHTLQSSMLEHTAVGVYANLPNASLTLNNVKKCNVTTSIFCASCAAVYGVMTTDCGVVNASKWSLSQGEPAIAVCRLPSGETVVVVVSMNPEYKYPGSQGVRSLLGMVSMDGGKTWTQSTIADGNPNNSAGNMLQAYSDPALAFDDFGNLFLTYNAYPPTQAALYVSSDNGLTFQAAPGFDGTDHHDLPRVAIGPSGLTGLGDAPHAVWVSRHRSSGISIAGAPIRGLGAANIGPGWVNTTLPNTYDFQISSVTVGPCGEVLLAYVEGLSGIPSQPPLWVYTALDQDGLGTSCGFTSFQQFQCNVGFQTVIDANPNGFAAPFIHVDWDRSRDRAYIVYPGRATPDPADQNLDVHVRFSTNKGVSWSAPRRVNDDSATRTQFHPRLAVDQLSGNVAVSWYDCRHDPQNRRVHFYAAVSRDGFASTTAPQTSS
jgi:hypothetical protein